MGYKDILTKAGQVAYIKHISNIVEGISWLGNHCDDLELEFPKEVDDTLEYFERMLNEI